MKPAVFVEENGEVVHEGCETSGITLSFGNDEWWAAIGVLDGAWIYVRVLPPARHRPSRAVTAG